MRSTLVLSVLAALLVAAVAYAAKPTSGSATLTSLGASGVNGSVDIRLEKDGSAKIHESIDGLTPGATYTSVLYLSGTGCGNGTVNVQIEQFTANNAGKANFVRSVPPQAVPILGLSNSITVQQGATQLSCGEIVFQ